MYKKNIVFDGVNLAIVRIETDECVSVLSYDK